MHSAKHCAIISIYPAHNLTKEAYMNISSLRSLNWKRILLLYLPLALLFLIVSAVVIFFISGDRAISTGYALVTDTGAVLLVDENGSAAVLNDSKDQNLSDKLQTGDKILVVHGAVMESYPARTKAYLLIKLESGSINNIPDSTLKSLSDLGWLNPKTEE